MGGLLVFLFVALPSALTEETVGVTGITLQAAPNAVAVSWTAVSNSIIVDHYAVSYAKESILQNNGRFLDQESTIDAETSLILLDAQNRGFTNGETMYVTVTAVDRSGAATPIVEEKSILIQAPGSSVTLRGLEQAVSENLTTVTLTFSTAILLPAENPANHFAITEEETTNPIGILAAVASGNQVILTTLPMTPRSHYAVSFSDALTASDGSPLDQTRRMGSFVARGDGTVPSSSSSVSSPLPIIEAPPVDTTAPEPPRMLVLRKVVQKNGLYTVHASWEESVNSEGDLAGYKLYESADRGATFAPATALQATITSTSIADVPPGTLTIKLTSVDEVPNESQGIQETIILPETGPALLLGMSAAGAVLFGRRRKRAR
jgi:hypothetical protein